VVYVGGNVGINWQTIYHVFWSYSAILSYWQEVIQVILFIFGDGIDCSFSTIYLGNLAAHVRMKNKYHLKILLAASKKAVTRKWLQFEPPTNF